MEWFKRFNAAGGQRFDAARRDDRGVSLGRRAASAAADDAGVCRTRRQVSRSGIVPWRSPATVPRDAQDDGRLHVHRQ